MVISFGYVFVGIYTGYAFWVSELVRYATLTHPTILAIGWVSDRLTPPLVRKYLDRRKVKSLRNNVLTTIAMAAKIENIGSVVNISQIGIDSRSTEDLIQLALVAPEEDDDYLKER